jgi:hypothetical protein
LKLKLEAPPKLAQSKRERRWGWGKVCYIIVRQQAITTTTNQILLKQTVEMNNKSEQITKANNEMNKQQK